MTFHFCILSDLCYGDVFLVTLADDLIKGEYEIKSCFCDELFFQWHDVFWDDFAQETEGF